MFLATPAEDTVKALLSPPPPLMQNSRIYQIFSIYLATQPCMLILIWFGINTVSNLCYPGYQTLPRKKTFLSWESLVPRVNLCMSCKIVKNNRRIWDKRTEKIQNVSLPLDFVNKPPSLISPLSIKPPFWRVQN